MRLLITGGLGLIGSEIADQAAERGWTLHIVDDRSGAVVDHIERGWAHDFEPIERVAREWRGVDQQPDVIVHCAAPVGPVGILGRQVLAECISSTQAAIALAARTGARLVVLSSSEVYGTVNPEGSLVVPDAWSHRTEYAVGKIVTEQLARRHYAETGAPTAVVRPWNVTGPRQSASKGFVFPRMAEQAVAGRPVTVYRPGTQRRAFMAVSDFAQGILDLLDQPEDAKAWECWPIDAAAPYNATTMLTLARTFTEHPLSLSRDWTSLDPHAEHGPSFREAAAGSKLPPEAVGILGTTPLEDMVDAAMRAAADRVKLAA